MTKRWQAGSCFNPSVHQVLDSFFTAAVAPALASAAIGIDQAQRLPAHKYLVLELLAPP